jgi:hypothetical protein
MKNGEDQKAEATTAAAAASETTAKQPAGSPSEVKLSAEQYNALLDRLAELETLATVKPREPEVADVDTLAEEGRRTTQAQVETEVNLDDMSNTQLVQYIADVINRQGGERLQRLEVAIESLRVAREIDRCEAKYKDFWNYEPDIRRIAISNPSLSIEQAYKLAKSTAEETSEDKSSKQPKESLTQRILNLPPRTFGEKPGAAASSTTSSTPAKTMKQAALKAWEEVVGKDKREI